MRTLVLDPSTAGLDQLMERRARSGLDRLDEVWGGVLHMIPAPSLAHARIAQQLAELLGPLARAAGLESVMHEFNLGESECDFRVPDGALHRPEAAGTWLPTAALVVEIVSPGDETWEKLPFYAAHHVDEVLIVDPEEREVHWLELAGEKYRDARQWPDRPRTGRALRADRLAINRELLGAFVRVGMHALTPRRREGPRRLLLVCQALRHLSKHCPGRRKPSSVFV